MSAAKLPYGLRPLSKEEVERKDYHTFHTKPKVQKPKHAKLAGVKAMRGDVLNSGNVYSRKGRTILPYGSVAFVLPADAASVERMREQIREAMINHPDEEGTPQGCEFSEATEAVLKSLGITSAKGRK